jgi:phosphatidylglycerol:prolipoprotein diacylglycerol transferase
VALVSAAVGVNLPEWLHSPLSGRPIFSYGVMLGVAFLLAWQLAIRLEERDGYDRRMSSSCFFWVIVASLVGARLAHFIASAPDQLSIANFFKFQEGGLVAYGGYILGSLTGIVYVKLRGAPVLRFCDNAAPSMALGLGVTRIGCFFYGCDFGTRSDLPWAVRFPRWDDPAVASWITGSAPAFDDHSASKILESTALSSAPVHPVQLYESLDGFALFAFLLWFLPRRRFDGQVLLLFGILYGVTRFLLELIRGDADRNENVLATGLSTSEAISVAVVAACAAAWIALSRRRHAVEIAEVEPAAAPRKGGRGRKGRSATR